LLDYLRKLLDSFKVPEGEEITVHIQTREIKDRLWLKSAAQDLSERLTGLEADLPKEKVASWYKAMQQASKPARYVIGKGIVVN